MKKLFLLTFAALTFVAAASEAYITPVRPRPYPPGRPSPERPHPRPPMPPPSRPNPGSFSVPVYVNRQVYGNDRLDVTDYIDLYQYRGYRLTAIDFVANASYNTALVDVLINGFQVAPTINLNRYAQTYRVFPNGRSYIGQGADSIVLYTRGDAYVQQVILQLSR